MPLIKSGSKEAFSANIGKERGAGKPLKQALAIAYSVKRKAGKMHKDDAGDMPGYVAKRNKKKRTMMGY